MEISKTTTTLYLDNEYIEYIAGEIAARRMDIEDLTSQEQEEVAQYRLNMRNRT